LSQLKTLTDINWLQRDSSVQHFTRVDKHGASYEISPGEWAELFLESRLSPEVPDHVVELFEVARGAMCYGYFYYPLFTLGNEQLYRVGAGGWRAKSKRLDVPQKGTGSRT
jgi:hypothetical protein